MLVIYPHDPNAGSLCNVMHRKLVQSDDFLMELPFPLSKPSGAPVSAFFCFFAALFVLVVCFGLVFFRHPYIELEEPAVLTVMQLGLDCVLAMNYLCECWAEMFLSPMWNWEY